MTTFVADLHVHSTASDGELTPSEIVTKASSIGISAIALTDHDTIDGLAEAQTAGLEHGVMVVPGIELSTVYRESDVHVLGYFIQPYQSNLCAKLEELRKARYRRALEILKRLQGLNLSISWEHVVKHLKGSIVGRPHIAHALMDAGYVHSVQEAFACYLEQSRPAYVPRHKLSPEEAINIIHESNGVAVLAHPGKLPDLSYLEPLLELDWQGIEVFHPDHSDADKHILQTIARSRNFIITGGSDFHGENRSHRKLGAYVVDKTVIELLRNKCQF